MSRSICVSHHSKLHDRMHALQYIMLRYKRCIASYSTEGGQSEDDPYIWNLLEH